MAPLTTHLVIGERIFAHLPRLRPSDYGAFLLGCVLVDVHVISDITRRDTHFAAILVGKRLGTSPGYTSSATARWNPPWSCSGGWA